jgi:nicotinamidase-related amidase
MNSQLVIENEKTALVLIDLQKGIVSMPTEPIPSTEVIKNANMLVQAFHKNKAQVVFVRVAYSQDSRNMLRPEVDEPTVRNSALPSDWSSIVPELEFKEGDLHITKRQWGAFYGTELDLELRRRKINTIVLGGISTNYGVESTARDAFERGYNLIFASDAMASRSTSDHEFAITRIFPRIGRVRKTEEIMSAMGV